MSTTRKTHCVRGHEFTPVNTYKRRNVRICRTCRREYAAERRAQLRDEGAA